MRPAEVWLDLGVIIKTSFIITSRVRSSLGKNRPVYDRPEYHEAIAAILKRQCSRLYLVARQIAGGSYIAAAL